MTIKIQTEKPSIPIEIGDLKFDFDLSDDSIAEFRKNSLDVQKELSAIEIDENDDKALEDIKEVLRCGYEIMLGKDAFDKIYELSPSVVIVMNYFVQLAEGIEKELNNMGLSQSQKEKAQKYIRSKKK